MERHLLLYCSKYRKNALVWAFFYRTEHWLYVVIFIHLLNSTRGQQKTKVKGCTLMGSTLFLSKYFFLRSSACLFFVILYLFAMLRPVHPMVTYFLNQDYIKTVLCINKDQPKLQCHGKCYLTKKLQQQQESPLSQLFDTVMEKYPIVFVYIVDFNSNKSPLIVRQKASFWYHNTYCLLPIHAIFHPPNGIG